MMLVTKGLITKLSTTAEFKVTSLPHESVCSQAVAHKPKCLQ